MKYFLDSYKYCPLCKGDLVHKKNVIECNKCAYRIFDNGEPSSDVLIENDKGELLMVTRKVDPYKGYLDFPGGFLIAGETLEEGLKREVKEELGINIKVEDYIADYIVEYEYKGLTYKVMTAFFKARLKGHKLRAGDDVSDFHFYSKEDILKSNNVCYPHVCKDVVRRYIKKYS